MRSIDFDDIAPAFHVLGHDLVTDHLRQRKRKPMPREIGGTDAAGQRSEQAKSLAQLQVKTTVSHDLPARALVSNEPVLGRSKRSVPVVLGGEELDFCGFRHVAQGSSSMLQTPSHCSSWERRCGAGLKAPPPPTNHPSFQPDLLFPMCVRQQAVVAESSRGACETLGRADLQSGGPSRLPPCRTC